MNELESLGFSVDKKKTNTKYGFFKSIQVFFNKIRIFLIYRNILKRNSIILWERFNIRFDDVYRLYTVIIIPPETMSLLSMKDNKYHMVFQQEVVTQITSYIKAVSGYLKTVGMGEEWYGLTEMTEIDQMNYKIVISFAFFDTVKVANWLLTIGLVSFIGFFIWFIWYIKQII
jgi:hypothetical protein